MMVPRCPKHELSDFDRIAINDDLPKTATGKIQRFKLREMA